MKFLKRKQQLVIILINLDNKTPLRSQALPLKINRYKNSITLYYQVGLQGPKNAGVRRPRGGNFFGPRVFWLLFGAMPKSDKAHDGQINHYRLITHQNIECTE